MDENKVQTTDPLGQMVGGEPSVAWGWLFAGGLLTVLVGWFMLGHLVFASVASVMYLGIAAIAAGVFQIINAFSGRRQGGFVWLLLWGLLVLIAGISILTTPVSSAATLTLIIACYLVVSGVWRLIVCLGGKMEGRAWLIFSSVLNILLAILLFVHWPLSGLVAIGVFVGIDFVFYGIWLMMRSLVVRQVAQENAAAKQTTA